MKVSQCMNLAVLGLVFTLSSAHAGGSGDKGHGGFAYRQSIMLLEDGRDELINQLKRLKENCFNEELAENGIKPVRFNRIIQALKNMKLSPSKNLSATNPSGEKYPLMFTYGKDAVTGVEFIEALQPYFVAYMSNAYGTSKILGNARMGDSNIPLFLVGALLFHEATHLFGFSELDALTAEEVFTRLYGFNIFNEKEITAYQRCMAKSVPGETQN